jgi:TRAF-interacting protein
MAKCNILGRGEARFSRKLEKAKEKMSKLKVSP